MGVAERKQREFERRERDILAAAIELFARDDWETVTVEQIAERAEIGKGTVYKHFAGKEEIYARLASQFQARALERLEAIDDELPVMQQLRAIIRVFWEQHRGAQHYERLVQYCEREDFRSRLGPSARAELQALDARFQARVDRALQKGVDEGVLPRKPLPTLVFGPMAALHGAARLIRGGCLERQPVAGHFLDEITNFILAGMLYQEWLAEEGLDASEATHRAEAELRAVEGDEV